MANPESLSGVVSFDVHHVSSEILFEIRDNNPKHRTSIIMVVREPNTNQENGSTLVVYAF